MRLCQPIKTATFALAGILLSAGTALAAADSITVASTTSTEASGLFGHILPKFEDKTGIEVKVIAQGTGQALETGRRGDADVVFVHAEKAEKRFVENNHGVKRHPVMYNDFIVVGPKADPANVQEAGDVHGAFALIAANQAAFASRGDNSGTHKAEKAIWQATGIEPGGKWYRATGSGMGQTLNTAAQMPAYTLADRGTWISFRNRGPLTLLFAGDPELRNQYGVILVHPEQHPNVRAEAGRKFIDWVTGEAGQAAIAGYRLRGKQLFHPNADG